LTANRLLNEKSPYLLQHAHNPVDWYPWGEEAFSKAVREDKPIFLSIGYSTCHWCHVMEHESFENEEVAAVLNRNFVPIKVDREERPDVDRVYMLFVQASTGSGGWPMSVWLTPQLNPFFGGTYFPPDNRYGRPGFRAILENLAKAWREDRQRVVESGAQVVDQLRNYVTASGGAAGSGGDASNDAGKEALDSAFFGFRRMFDARLGGFGGAPKFPRPSVLNFLLRYHVAAERVAGGTGNGEALDMVTLTLREMAKGGMHDQLGGGFHRYSVDERWFVPHFEKMLYDQAQLAISYLEAFQLTRDAQYASAASDIFSYVQRDLTDRDGGFYSAEDADSAMDAAHPTQKSEGAFYLWTRGELEDALGPADAAIFCFRFGVEPSGNVEEDPHGEFGGKNILYRAHTEDETAAHFGIRIEEARAVLKNAFMKLPGIRAARPRPHLDDKILTAWNGLMISAFAKGAQILDEPRYVDAARAAANFIRRRLWDGSRRVLLRRYRDGDSAIDGFLDDYAFFINALLDLYETGFEAEDLKFAAELATRAMELFEDREHGAFFSTPVFSTHEPAPERRADLVLRLKDDYDGAEPSGNSAMAMALLRLARMTGREDFRASAERTLHAFAARMKTGGAGVPQMLVALAFAVARPMEIVLARPPHRDADESRPVDVHRDESHRDDPGIQEMLRTIRRHFLPSAVVIMANDMMAAARMTNRTAVSMPPVNGRATAYVCENYACKLPVTEVAALDQELAR
jgi:hypothetical protein